ncbi:MAG: sigma-70 family RNA polymerase sigma factor [candidate division Zixibacteria bacterium]|nr:sigma-70 family RNA polymerase sigma factor [candidate division Zixibacteria bacterium]
MTEKDDNRNTPLSDPDTWVDKYGDYLYRYALARLRDKRQAEDAVQETFLAALQARSNFAGQSSEKTWLVGILKNKIIDLFRKSERESKHEDIDAYYTSADDDFAQSGANIGQWQINRRPADWAIDSSNSSEVNEFWEFLMACLSQVPKKIADIYVLREIEGFENEEICNKLDVSATNIRVMLHRARKQLRRCLELNWLEKKS